MTPEQLNEIKARANSATPGPWEAKPGKQIDDDLYDYTVFGDGKAICWSQPDYDAEFIAHARTDIPLLLLEIELLQAQNAKLDKALGECRRKLN